MASWHLAPALVQLRREIDARFPGRSKVSDGSIGDAAHSARTSDHNPDAAGTVCAIDVTGAGGVGDAIWNFILTKRPARVKYAIYRGRMVRSYDKPGVPAWTPTAYTGSNQHTSHIHVSVTQSGKTSAAAWGFTGAVAQAVVPVVQKVVTRVANVTTVRPIRPGEKSQRVKSLQMHMNRNFPLYSKLRLDGDYGPASQKVIRTAQRRLGLKQDAIVGRATARALNFRL